MSADLSPAARAGVRDLILVLADSKRLLGTRYAEWILGAPELEAGIACASMAQDEWGHGRLLYALLREFDEDIERLEHGREAGEYASIEVLDRSPGSWPEFVALNAFVDTALTIQFEAMRESAFTPMRQRVEKLVEEEHFHAAHGAAWLRMLASASAASRAAMTRAAGNLLTDVLRWFGPDSDRARLLVETGIADAAGSGLRERYLERVAPLLAALDAGALADVAPAFDAFDEGVRRVGRAGPDAETVEKIRGDKNRAFLMD